MEGYDGMVTNRQDLFHNLMDTQEKNPASCDGRRFQKLLEYSRDHIALIDAQGKLLYTNAVDHLLGYPREVYLELNPYMLIHPADLPRAQACFATLLATPGAATTIELRNRHQAGHYVWTEVTARNLLHDPDIGALVLYSHDITERQQIQNALAEARSLLCTLLDAMPDLIYVKDLHHRFVLCNAAACHVLHDLPPEAIIGKTDFDFFPPTVAAQFHADEAAIFQTGKPLLNQEQQVTDRNGQVIWIATTKVLLRNLEGEIIGLVGFSHNITERKRHEQQLHFYASLQQNLNDAIITTDLEMCITSWNRAAETIYGWRASAVIGRPVREILQTQYASEALRQAIWQELFQQGWWQGEVIQYHQNGAPLSILRSLALLRDENGTSFGIVAINRDITARKRAEKALRAEEARYRLLAENVTDMVSLYNADLEIIYVSPSSQLLLGYEPQALIGHSAFAFVHPEDLGVLQQLYQTVVEQSIPVAAATCRIRHQAGHYLWIEFGARIIRSPETGVVQEFITSARDITQRKLAEAALRESEEKFRRLMEAAPVAIIITDQHGAITLVNDQAELLWGYQRAELLGQPIEILIDDALWERYVQQCTTCAAEPSPWQMNNGLERLAKHKDGHQFPVEIELSHIATAAGLMVISFVVDITERKQTAAALREQRDFLQLVIDSVPDLIMVKDAAGRFQLVNERTAQVYGVTPAAMVGKQHSDVHLRQAELAFFRQTDEVTLSRGEAIFIPEIASLDHFYQASKIPLRNGAGQYDRLLIVASDITERKKAEETIRQNEEKFRNLIETMSGGLAMYDLEERITYVNERYCELLGYTQQELIGTSVYSHVEPESIAVIKHQLTYRYQGESTSYEVGIKRKDGQRTYWLVSGSPWYNEQRQIIGSFAVVNDITIQKQAEATLHEMLKKERELGELKSRFVSMASHEFRTPLASILMLTETLHAYRHKLTDAQIVQRLDSIREQVDHLRTVMEDVLQLAQMQAWRVQPKSVLLDFDALCRSVIDEYLQQPAVTHRLVYHADVAPCKVLLDKRLMRQVVSNLVSNAIKYSPPDKAIHVNLTCVGQNFRLMIRDEGIGIPPADLPHLFQPFHRATNVGAISGTGLGLVITKESLELLGGTISVESEVDVGTTVTVSIPIITESD